MVKRLKNRIIIELSAFRRLVIVLNYNFFSRNFQRLFLRKKIRTSRHPDYAFVGFNTASQRVIEIAEDDKSIREAVITCYFTRKPDPQFGFVRMNPDFSYIRTWYESLEKLDIHGVIVHDGLDPEFIRQHQTPQIRFREFSAGWYSIFEERWMAYYLFLAGTNLQKVFFTDVGDVVITRNPFGLISRGDAVYIGRDQAAEVGLSGWMTDELDRYIQDSGIPEPSAYRFQPVYNAGVAGGSRNAMLFFIREVIRKICLTQTDCHKDMNILNLVIHENFYPRIRIKPPPAILTDAGNDAHARHSRLVSGFPLNSEFGKYQLRSDAFFIHK